MSGDGLRKMLDDRTQQAELQGYRMLRDRLKAGEPVRILIGADLNTAMECIPHENWLAGCRAQLVAEAERQIGELEKPRSDNGETA
ncbi:MAG: hypothetical protein ACK4GT_00290 [Pararhodobacter sp.]